MQAYHAEQMRKCSICSKAIRAGLHGSLCPSHEGSLAKPALLEGLLTPGPKSLLAALPDPVLARISGSCGVRARLQRRGRSGFTPDSLVKPPAYDRRAAKSANILTYNSDTIIPSCDSLQV
jgi:hypothetical protein